MIITLKRKIFTDVSTIGELYIGDEKVCYTLEDVDRGLNSDMEEKTIRDLKVYGKTAIPTGKYEVIVNYSNNFKQYMPLLLGVKGFEGVRIHSGNTDASTLGCVLVGKSFSKDFIGQSREAYKALFTTIQRAVKEGKVYLEIVKG